MKIFSHWQVFALGSALFAGLTILFGKIGVGAINSNLAVLIRTVVILVISIAVVSMTDQWQKPSAIDAKTWISLVLSAIATGFSWLCYYRALQLGPMSKVAAVDKLSIATAVILGVFFLGEKLSWKVFLGTTLMVVGAILMAWPL